MRYCKRSSRRSRNESRTRRRRRASEGENRGAIVSEHEGGESKSVGAFLLGFLTGVLVCLGAGGALFLVVGRHAVMVERARAEEAREVAEMERQRAIEIQRKADEAEKKAKKGQ